MKNLDGKTIPVGNLLSQEFFFRIPEYQRPFSWEGDNFEDLVDDIVTASKEQEYFLGTIVLQKMNHHASSESVTYLSERTVTYVSGQYTSSPGHTVVRRYGFHGGHGYAPG